jgi:hypothetical protein
MFQFQKFFNDIFNLFGILTSTLPAGAKSPIRRNTGMAVPSCMPAHYHHRKGEGHELQQTKTHTVSI